MNRLVAIVVTLVACSGLVLSGCSESAPKEDKKTVQETISDIGTEFAEAKYLEFALTTEKLPSDVNGIKSAIGSGNRTPAFVGDIDLVTGGTAVGAEVISRDGEVWAKTAVGGPLFLKIDPASIDAPDPALLVGTSNDGLVAIFDQATELKSDGKSREGNLVLETIVGTLPGSLFADLLPTASGKNPFTVKFRVTEQGAFHDLMVTGEFYRGNTTTYRLKISIPEEPVVIPQPNA
ncbi:MAG: LppX_LprAFG lipoprotein [Aeromicrobium sp.]|nr:MAG: LppX_LprAFG lipoprotein [Aeromicrobium sp.]